MSQPNSSGPDCSRLSATFALLVLVVIAWLELSGLVTTYILPALH